jgi:hypothetical protein
MIEGSTTNCSPKRTAMVEQIETSRGGFFTSEVVEFRPDLSYFPAK